MNKGRNTGRSKQKYRVLLFVMAQGAFLSAFRLAMMQQGWHCGYDLPEVDVAPASSSDTRGESHRASALQPYNICAIVRTHPGQSNVLPITLLSLTQQSDLSTISVTAYVVNTDPKDYAVSDFLYRAVSDANERAGHHIMDVLDESFHTNPPNASLYGYDDTDKVLEQLLTKNSTCTYFLFTNGDNFYSNKWLLEIKPFVLANKQLIAWDFISHHRREYNVISTEVVRGKIDLGAAIVAKSAIESINARFTSKEHLAHYNAAHALDYFFFKSVSDAVGRDAVEIFHQVLFSHQ
ncbi:hypothetical protein ACHAW6_008660 [Cyclotella cf. meneghiniana]